VPKLQKFVPDVVVLTGGADAAFLMGVRRIIRV
jgi:hypothetical protein